MFKNMKIRRKLIVSFCLVALLGIVASIFSIQSMIRLKSQYNSALVEYGFAQGDVGQLMSAFCRVDGNIHDAISYIDSNISSAAVSNFKKQSDKLNERFDTVEATLVTQDEKDVCKTARDAWNDYYTLAGELVDLGSATIDTEADRVVQKRLVDELDPHYIVIYNAMTDLMSLKVDQGNNLQEKLSAYSTAMIVIIVILMVVALGVSLLLSMLIARGIAAPIHLCTQRLAQLAKGDLSSPVPEIDSKGEVGILSESTKSIVNSLSDMIHDIDYILREMSHGNFNVRSKNLEIYVGDFASLVTSLRGINSSLTETLTQISQSADQVTAGASQVSNGAQALAQGATEQASAVEELAATVNEIAQQITANAEAAQNADKLSDEAGAGVMESNQYMKDMMLAMHDITNTSNEIGKIIKTIDDIAFQTNILALNAAVEAARAGAAGKGFAVVADEVRNLAGKSAEAAKNTTVLIENAITAIENGTKIADKTAQSLAAVVEKASHVNEHITNIARASEEQSHSIVQISTGVDQISAVVQTNSATSEESAAASEELSSLAATMRNLLTKFHLSGNKNYERLPDSTSANSSPTFAENESLDYAIAGSLSEKY